MPLVRTPMIAPTKIYDAFPAITPEEAADMILPEDVATARAWAPASARRARSLYALSPKAVDRILHLAYRVFPDFSRLARPEGHRRASLLRADRDGDAHARGSLVGTQGWGIVRAPYLLPIRPGAGPPWPATGVELGRPDHEAEPIRAATQPGVDGHKAAAEQRGQRDVLGVVGFRPAEGVGDPPRLVREAGIDFELDVRIPQSGASLIGLIGAQFTTPSALAYRRTRLAPHKRRCAKLVGEQFAEIAHRPARRTLDAQAGIDNQHAAAQ